MVGALLIVAAVAVALLAASAARLPSLVSTLLVAYLAFVANLGIVTLALSPFHEVTRGGLAVAEAVLLAAALAAWWSRGRPRPAAGTGARGRAEVVADPLTALFLVFVARLLAYELVLALTVPPNNGDSLMYHLPRAAAWAQHGGIYWIPNAPNVALNAYQPLAEQQILFLFVATGSGALLRHAAIPRRARDPRRGLRRRRGGSDSSVRAAACSACLLATFSLLALEATTAQNDLVAASFPRSRRACCSVAGRPSRRWPVPRPRSGSVRS